MRARPARRGASFRSMRDSFTHPQKQLCPLTRAQLITFEGLLLLSGLFLSYLLLRLLCFRCHVRNSVVGLVRGPSIYTNNQITSNTSRFLSADVLAMCASSLQRENEIPILLRNRRHRKTIASTQNEQIRERRCLVRTQLIERNDVLELAHEPHVHGVPPGRFSLAVGIVVFALGVEGGRVGVGSPHDVDDAGDAGCCAVGVVEKRLIALFYRVAQQIARLIVAHAVPGSG